MDNTDNRKKEGSDSKEVAAIELKAAEKTPENDKKPVNGAYYRPVPIVKRVYKPVDKKDIIFLALFFAAAFLIVFLGIWGRLHLGLTIAYYILFGVTSAYIFKRANVFAIICGVLSLAGALTFTLINDFYINLMMLVFVGGLFAVYSLGISDAFNVKQGSFRMLFDVLKGVSINVFDSFSEVIGGIKANASERKKSLSGVIGALVALPVLIVIIPLLVSSDAAFEGLITAIGKNVGIVLLQLAIAAVITPYIYTFAFEKKRQLNKYKGAVSTNGGNAPSSACTSFLAVISVVYVVYLFSQLAYFFSAFKGILPADYQYTASAFARRGFFEMFAICVINVTIVSLTLLLAKKKSLAIKLLSCFISLFSVLMIAIAMQKMRLNVSIYGLSKNRVLVCVFMLMLLVAIAFFIMHIFAPRISYMQPIIIICSAIFIALSLGNTDRYIAEYNIRAYESGKICDLDVDAISNLSSSAVPSLVSLMDSESTTAARQATREVASLYMDMKDNDGGDDLRCYNLSSKRARSSVMEAHNTLFDNIVGILSSSSYNDWYYNDEADEYVVYDKDYNEITYSFDEEQGIYVRVVDN